MGRNSYQNSKYSNNVFVKIWLILNVVLGIASGSFFSYETHKSCGGIYSGQLICCFSFAFINLFLLGFNQLWKKWFHIFNIIVFLTISVIAFITVYEIYQQTICESQWCISKVGDSRSFTQSFKDSQDLKDITNTYCQQEIKAQKKTIQQYALKQYNVQLKAEDMWNIENSTPFALSSCIGSISILFSFLLAMDTIRQFKYKPKNQLLV